MRSEPPKAGGNLDAQHQDGWVLKNPARKRCDRGPVFHMCCLGLPKVLLIPNETTVEGERRPEGDAGTVLPPKRCCDR